MTTSNGLIWHPGRTATRPAPPVSRQGSGARCNGSSARPLTPIRANHQDEQQGHTESDHHAEDHGAIPAALPRCLLESSGGGRAAMVGA